MKTPTVGIIIPAYNVAPYIKDCLDSIINQTYTNWKAVIINDGSTDNTLQIAEQYQKQYPDKINIIDQKNSGVAYTRNTGLSYFKDNPTDYTIFIDSDDWWERHCLETCINNIGDSDILNFKLKGVRKHKDGTVTDNKHSFNFGEDTNTVKQVTRQEWLESLADEKSIIYGHNHTSVSISLIRTSLIQGNNLTFRNDLHYWEDSYFGKILYLSANKITILDQVLYNYRIRPSSLTTSSSVKKPYEHLKEHYQTHHSNKEAKEHLYFLTVTKVYAYFKEWVILNIDRFNETELHLIKILFFGLFDRTLLKTSKLESWNTPELKRLTDIMNKPLTEQNSKSIGIIIPAYNVAPYIKDCLDSIINQTYTNWKAVIINDGSTDNTLQIAEQYAQKDSRITVLSHTNKGQSYTRNTGLSYFKDNPTDYTIFIDSDDWWERHCLETCINNIGDSDILWIQGLYYWDSRKTVTRAKNWAKNFKEHIQYINKEQYNQYVMDSKIYELDCYSVLALVKHEVLYSKHIKFLEGVVYEDNIYTLQMIAHSNKIAISNYIGYYYRQRDGSTCNHDIKTHKYGGTDIYNLIPDTEAANFYFAAYSWGSGALKVTELIEKFPTISPAVSKYRTYWIKQSLRLYSQYLESAKRLSSVPDPYKFGDSIKTLLTYLPSGSIRSYRSVIDSIQNKGAAKKRIIFT